MEARINKRLHAFSGARTGSTKPASNAIKISPNTNPTVFNRINFRRCAVGHTSANTAVGEVTVIEHIPLEGKAPIFFEFTDRFKEYVTNVCYHTER
jgi:hypothetical protein